MVTPEETLSNGGAVELPCDFGNTAPLVIAPWIPTMIEGARMYDDWVEHHLQLVARKCTAIAGEMDAEGANASMCNITVHEGPNPRSDSKTIRVDCKARARDVLRMTLKAFGVEASKLSDYYLVILRYKEKKVRASSFDLLEDARKKKDRLSAVVGAPPKPGVCSPRRVRINPGPSQIIPGVHFDVYQVFFLGVHRGTAVQHHWVRD